MRRANEMNPDDLDAQLKDGKVSRDALEALLNAEGMDCATSIGWLEEKLRVLENTVARIPLHIDAPGASRTLISAADFAAWCRTKFPNAYGIPSPPNPGWQMADWIRENLIDDGKFVFRIGSGSPFGERLELYSTPLVEQSVLISAMAGVISPAPFRVSELLAVLKDLAAGETAAWIWCSENSASKVARVLQAEHFDDKIWPFDDAYVQSRMLSRFEQLDPLRMQAGESYLQFLMSGSRRWMLINRRNRDSFLTELLGERAMLDTVRRRLRLKEAS
jgi:hypothetical protein